MSKAFLMRAALAMVAVMCAVVVLESQADACGRRGRRCRDRDRGCEATCGAPAEAACGAPVEEVTCAAPEPTCGCAVEPSCGCEASSDDGCGRKRRLFGRRNRDKGCCSCEVSCGEPVNDSGEMDAAPPAPEV